MKYTTKDISDYYSQTLTHYKTWWNLSKNLSVHYGMWGEGVKSFDEALLNTNQKLADFGMIKKEDKVLDAGCGVGGMAFFLAKEIGCEVEGITLSQKQIDIANSHKFQTEYGHLAKFSLQDYTKTNFPDGSFNVIIACESVCYATPKETFIKEAFRLLKPGGRLVICDYFLTESGIEDREGYLKKWGDTWAISNFNIKGKFEENLTRNGFEIHGNQEFTKEIYPSARRMYFAYLLGAIPSILYNLTHNTSRFAKTHYLSGKYQFLALKKGHWEYRIIGAVVNKS